MMTCKHLFIIALLPILLLACSKEPGVGGKSSISGYVFVKEISNNTGQPTGDEYYAPEERVYIRYGENEFHDDDVRTGPEGLFKFDWLRKGDYTIFVYTECPTCDSEVDVVEVEIEITENSESIELDDIVIENWVN